MDKIVLPNPLKILIADDNIEICESLAESIKIYFQLFEINKNDVKIETVFTDQAYTHGCEVIKKTGFVPHICIFDLVFNGYTGSDLYEFILDHVPNTVPFLCIYTGIEQNHEKLNTAKVLASKNSGKIKIIQKPNIDEIFDWLDSILIDSYGLQKIIIANDPFDAL